MSFRDLSKGFEPNLPIAVDFKAYNPPFQFFVYVENATQLPKGGVKVEGVAWVDPNKYTENNPIPVEGEHRVEFFTRGQKMMKEIGISLKNANWTAEDIKGRTLFVYYISKTEKDNETGEKEVSFYNIHAEVLSRPQQSQQPAKKSPAYTF